MDERQAGVEVGASAIIYAKKRSTDHMQIKQSSSMMATQIMQVPGMKPEPLLRISILGVLNGMQVRISSQPQNSLHRPQSPLMHPAHGMTLRRAFMSTSQLLGLGLVSSTACLLCPNKPKSRTSFDALRHYRTKPTSEISTISCRARQWSLRRTPSSSFPTTAVMDGLIIA